MKYLTPKTERAYIRVRRCNSALEASIADYGERQMTKRNGPDPWMFTPFNVLSSFADLMVGNRLLFAEACGEVLHSTSSLVMLATSRTPAQWITGLPNPKAPQSTAAQSTGPAHRRDHRK